MLDYNAIFNAIPVDWKEILSEINYNDIDINSITEAIASIVNIMLISLKISKLQQNQLENQDCAFCILKFYTNISPTNILLHRMGIKNSDQCDHCQEREVVEDLFINCPRLRGFWSNVFNEILVRTATRVPKTDQNILFGVPVPSSQIIGTKSQLKTIIIFY